MGFRINPFISSIKSSEKSKIPLFTLLFSSFLLVSSHLSSKETQPLATFVPDSLISNPSVSETGRTRVDFFAGVDFNYRDIYHNKLYEFLINLTPGVKWYMGHRWQVAAQALIPVYNDYGAYYRRVRLNMAVLSKEWDWRRRFFLKASGGLFGNERYGIDLKAAYIATPWLAFDWQAGLTGFCSMATGWSCSEMTRVTGLASVRFYIPRAQTEFRLQGGRYIFTDYAVKGEAMRHFRHCTIGIYAQYSDLGKDNYGFKVVMMIPPYRRPNTRVRVRPASAFRLTYNQNADPYAVKTYTTDPEENEREGWFDRGRFQWGIHTQEPDFRLREPHRMRTDNAQVAVSKLTETLSSDSVEVHDMKGGVQ